MTTFIFVITHLIAFTLGMTFMAGAFMLRYNVGTLNVRREGTYFIANEKLKDHIERKFTFGVIDINVYDPNKEK